MRAFVLFILGSVMIVASPSQAQQQKYVGFVLGANFANESLDSLPDGIPSHRTGILAGLQIERWFSPQWGLGMQIIYAQEGRNEDLNGPGRGIFYGFARKGSVNIEANYLDVPSFLKKTIFENNVVHTYAFAGPVVGFFLSGSVHQNILISGPGITSFENDTTFALPASSLDFSVLFGLGVSVKLDSGQMLFLDASYWYGLTNIFESYGGATYTRDLRLTAGILFPIHLPSLLF